MKKIILCALIAFLLCSCGMAIKRNNKNLMELEIGMAKTDVITVMGVPRLSESYESIDGKRVTILYYKTEDREMPLISGREECTPVIIVDGKLEGWGDRLTYAQFNKLKVSSK